MRVKFYSECQFFSLHSSQSHSLILELTVFGQPLLSTAMCSQRYEIIYILPSVASRYVFDLKDINHCVWVAVFKMVNNISTAYIKRRAGWLKAEKLEQSQPCRRTLHQLSPVLQLQVRQTFSFPSSSRKQDPLIRDKQGHHHVSLATAWPAFQIEGSRLKVDCVFKLTVTQQ